jgi:hypothetical protein
MMVVEFIGAIWNDMFRILYFFKMEGNYLDSLRIMLVDSLDWILGVLVYFLSGFAISADLWWLLS